MGAVPDDKSTKPGELPNREIEFPKGFLIGKYEVTVGQFAAFVNDTRYKTTAERNGKGGWKSGHATSWGEQSKEFIWNTPGYSTSENFPVSVVSYHDAVAYCDWLCTRTAKKYRLPTEAEWEYACRAGTNTIYHFDIRTRDEYCWSTYSSEAPTPTRPVGTRLPNAWGIHDMTGNVREWCLDWFAENAYSQPHDQYPQGPPTGESRVIRGACFLDREMFMRSSHRGYLAPDMPVNNQGFRVVCED
jgi:formylglycine-generating enzyme required for sulfatase activity